MRGKGILLGDVHTTGVCPVQRTDDNYLDTLLHKLRYVFTWGREHGFLNVYSGGDWYDRGRMPHWVEAEMTGFLNEFNDMYLYTVYGQHDQRYHSVNIANTPLNVLVQGGLAAVLDHTTMPRGMNWGEQIPSAPPHSMLVGHVTVSNRVEMFDTVNANTLLRGHPEYDIILTGDNHMQFHVEKNGRWLINPGSIMRSRVDQMDHKPCFYTFEFTSTMPEVHRYEIPVRPAAEVFNVNDVVRTRQENLRLTAFVNGLTDTTQLDGVDFLKNLEDLIVQTQPSQELTDILHTCIQECSEERGM